MAYHRFLVRARFQRARAGRVAVRPSARATRKRRVARHDVGVGGGPRRLGAKRCLQRRLSRAGRADPGREPVPAAALRADPAARRLLRQHGRDGVRAGGARRDARVGRRRTDPLRDRALRRSPGDPEVGQGPARARERPRPRRRLVRPPRRLDRALRPARPRRAQPRLDPRRAVGDADPALHAAHHARLDGLELRADRRRLGARRALRADRRDRRPGRHDHRRGDRPGRAGAGRPGLPAAPPHERRRVVRGPGGM